MTSFLSLIFSLKQQKISKDLIIYLGKLILSMACSALLLVWPSPCYKPNSGICCKAKICSPCRLPQALQPVWEESVIWSLKTVWPPLLSLSLSVFTQTKQGQEVSVFVWVSSAGLTSLKPASHMIQFTATTLRPEKSMTWHLITYIPSLALHAMVYVMIQHQVKEITFSLLCTIY